MNPRSAALHKSVIHDEHGVVAVRRCARQLAGLLGFDMQDQVRIATAVSEIARNAVMYAGHGSVEFVLEQQNAGRRALLVRVTDQGPGIREIDRLSDSGNGPSGPGMGIAGARRLMDDLQIESPPGGGTVVVLRKTLTKGAVLSPAKLAQIFEAMSESQGGDVLQELQQANQELIRTMEDLRRRGEDLATLNNELEDTNRGVVALYAELDEKADRLRRADEMKSRFLSNMGHEFRTPLNSILALSRLLLDHTDGELSPEQQKQVQYIRSSAENLYEMVNDLLDLAKVEAGKIVVRPAQFEVTALFGALRGVLRPLLTNDAVNLVFEEPSAIPAMNTDEGKVSQILRNFVTNALKFTERGEVRVAAKLSEDRSAVVFSVSDTGIGIAPEHQELIFQEFTQLDSPLQQRSRGTGLGLPLSRRLAELLGGSMQLESEPGVGSTFSVTIPLIYPGGSARAEMVTAAWRASALVIDDDPVWHYLMRQFLAGQPFAIQEAASGREGLSRARSQKPDVIFLDLMLPGLSGFDVLKELRSDPQTRSIPVIILTSKVLDERDREELLSGAVAIVSKEASSQEDGMAKVSAALAQAGFPPEPVGIGLM
jgi:signal transduction histidine kinase/CheY-like chemotaxis protein